MRKNAKAKRKGSVKKDLAARKTSGVRGGVERASTQVLPYIEQTPDANAAMADGSVRFLKDPIRVDQ